MGKFLIFFLLFNIFVWNVLYKDVIDLGVFLNFIGEKLDIFFFLKIIFFNDDVEVYMLLVCLEWKLIFFFIEYGIIGKLLLIIVLIYLKDKMLFGIIKLWLNNMFIVIEEVLGKLIFFFFCSVLINW